NLGVSVFPQPGSLSRRPGSLGVSFLRVWGVYLARFRGARRRRNPQATDRCSALVYTRRDLPYVHPRLRWTGPIVTGVIPRLSAARAERVVDRPIPDPVRLLRRRDRGSRR